MTIERSSDTGLEAFVVRGRSLEHGDALTPTQVRGRVPRAASLHLAPSARRALAASLDLVPVAALTAGLWWLGFGGVHALVPDQPAFWPEHVADLYNHRTSALMAPLWGVMLATVFWSLLSQGMFKRWVGLEVVDRRGERPPALQHALRSVGCGVSVATLGLGWLLIWILPSRRALHDVLSQTWVVRSASG